MDVLVYTQPAAGSTATDPPALVTLLRAILHPFYTVQAITASSLASHPWEKSCALLVLQPTGSAVTGLPMPPKAGEAVQRYVENGGRVLTLGLDMLVGARRSGEGQLQLYDPRSRRHISPTAPAGVPELRSGNVRLRTGELLSDVVGLSSPFSDAASGSALARWEQASSDGTETEGQNVAAVELPVGEGRISAWAVNFTEDTIQSSNNQLRLFLQSIVASTGLSVPSGSAEIEKETGGAAAAPPHRPLPQFLVTAKLITTEIILASLGVPTPESFSTTSSAASPSFVLKDTADTFGFHFCTPEAALGLLQQARADDAHAGGDTIKSVIVLPPAVIPSLAVTPKFDLQLYFNNLEKARKANGLPDVSQEGSCGMGEALFYGEAVTSTQTMLDKNQHLASRLPPPILSLATHQLAGRGRGRNTWLSPAGCLQFSLLLRAAPPALPAPRLVFVQYLFGLAVVRACRDAAVLGPEAGAGVRLKWPNDVYVVRGGEKKKIGGVLVNTSFSGGKVDIVIGCGLNVSTPPPIASLSLLSPAQQPPLRPETVLPVILAKFEALWAAFVQGRGSWAPFADAYLDAWMHSDQLVTLTTLTPPRPVRILGITPDHGLLRTLPERAAWGGAEEGYIDLQPDGNSFDLMAGLIRSKT
ncbi:class II aaRS and biotin synthetase [Dentipellis sp. KUC8613]|nr:class II aaRS and biotin synthetase [Dentipellis sp. KUC8613]